MSAAPPPIVQAPADEPDLLHAAARGDRNAQSILAMEAIAQGNAGETDPMEAWAAAEVMGRLAASHGDPVDVQGFAGLLFLRARWDRANGRAARALDYEAEAILLLDQLSDLGCDAASAMLMSAGKSCHPNAIRIAQGRSLLVVDVAAVEAKAAEMEATGNPRAQTVKLASLFYRAQEAMNACDGLGILETGFQSLAASAADGDADAAAIIDVIKRTLCAD